MKLELHCIDLDQPAFTGFRKFISSWLVRNGACSLLVDPGPASTIPYLVAELRRCGVETLDYILLTHIHIDHAGGTGTLLREFPGAQVVCHPEGVRHLVSPEKLWLGSRQVLGAPLADAYGEILPVPEGQIGFAETLGSTGVRTYLTPGHAPHHCCYLLGDLLFAGEVAGVRCELEGGIYLRPATPPRFIQQTALDSLERMLSLMPRRMVFAHYGLVEEAMTHLRIARDQLRLWVEGAAQTLALPEAEREEAFFSWLLERDPVYRNIDRLPADIRTRERIFLGNTLRGMSEYAAGLTGPEALARSG